MLTFGIQIRNKYNKFVKEKIYGNEEQTVVVIDTGAKFAIIRNVRELGYRAVVVPWDTSYEKIMSYN